MSKKSKRVSVSVGLFLVFALAAGGAYAYWTNNGTGTGSASTDNPAAGQLSVSGNAITGLAPGVAAQPLTGTITNNGTNSFTVTGLSAAITSVERCRMRRDRLHPRSAVRRERKPRGRRKPAVQQRFDRVQQQGDQPGRL